MAWRVTAIVGRWAAVIGFSSAFQLTTSLPPDRPRYEEVSRASPSPALRERVPKANGRGRVRVYRVAQTLTHQPLRGRSPLSRGAGEGYCAAAGFARRGAV